MPEKVEPAPLWESILKQQVRVGDACSATYKGKYYPAKILQVLDDGKKAKIKFEKFKFFPVVRVEDLRFPEGTKPSPKSAKRRSDRLVKIAREEAEYRAIAAKHEAERKASVAKAEAERRAATAKVEAERKAAAAAAAAEHEAKVAQLKAEAEQEEIRTKTERVVVTEEEKGFLPLTKDLILTELFRDSRGRASVGNTIKKLRAGKRVFRGQRLPSKFYMISKRLSKHRKYDVWYTIEVRGANSSACLSMHLRLTVHTLSLPGANGLFCV